MNIFLWILQFLLAAHTAMGAVWKFSNPEQNVSSLQAIPHGMWLALSVVELLCAVGLVLPAIHKASARLAPAAAAVVASEMILFCAVHLISGDRTLGSPVYWLVVAALCALVVWGRLVRKPL
jgi:hypothetical protein